MIAVSFEDWLARQRNRNSRLGDLARDVARDPNWPARAGIEEYRFYIQRQPGWGVSLNAFDNAWRSYNSFLRKG